jgi:hypothetical protein
MTGTPRVMNRSIPAAPPAEDAGKTTTTTTKTDPKKTQAGKDVFERLPPLSKQDLGKMAQLPKIELSKQQLRMVDEAANKMLKDPRDAARTSRSTRVVAEPGAQKDVSVTDRAGVKITLHFAKTDRSEKQVKGDLNVARNSLQSLAVSRNKAEEWKKLDKFDLKAVKGYMNSLGLNVPDKVKFMRNYATAYYNHTGNDIEWRGARLQNGIDAVPVDKDGRKYLDCEGFARLSQKILGEDKVKAYSVRVNSPDRRDHAVGIYQEGNQTYVISNNEITKVQAQATPDATIRSKYPEFRDAVADDNPMNYGTKAYLVGNSYKELHGATVVNVLNSRDMIARKGNDGGNGSFHMKVHVRPDMKIDMSYDLRPGDTIFNDKGRAVEITQALGNNRYRAILHVGNQQRVVELKTTGSNFKPTRGNWN